MPAHHLKRALARFSGYKENVHTGNFVRARFKCVSDAFIKSCRRDQVFPHQKRMTYSDSATDNWQACVLTRRFVLTFNSERMERVPGADLSKSTAQAAFIRPGNAH